MAALSPSRLAGVSGLFVAGLTAIYAIVLSAGLLTLPSSDHPIQDPWFTLMEVLILGIAPAAVAFSVGLRASVPESRRPAALLAVVFMSMSAVVTCVVHFTVLTLSRVEPFASAEWASVVFAFRWPSLAYALDILAWDFFFAAGCVFSVVALDRVSGVGLERGLLLVAAILSFAGLLGLVLASMAVRNLGIIGYVLFYPLAVALLARKLWPARGRSAA